MLFMLPEKLLRNVPAGLFRGPVLFLFIFLFKTGITHAQQCSGSLGDPVFLETFGQAPTAAKPTLGDPLPAGITTYTYYRPGTGGNPTGPYPGQYTISNTTRGYNNIYFVDRPDHTSTDGRGFCMVVDANATPDKFYERTITGLCAGTTFEFSAWIMNINPQGNVSNPSLRFDIMDANNPNGAPIASVSTGQVSYNAPGTWVRQAGVFQMPSSTSSVILRIFSNTPSSQGNDLALDDIAFAACGPPITFTQDQAVVCSGSTTTLTASLPAGSYSSYFFQLQRRALGTTDWEDVGDIVPSQGSNSHTFTITDAQAGYEYRVVAAGGRSEINNVNCRVVSAPVELKVIDYSVTINGDQSVCYNTSATLNAEITPEPGTGTPSTGFTFQWETSPNGITGWTAVTGQTGTTITTPPLTAAAYYRVTATVSGCSGNGTSGVFGIAVNPEIAGTLGAVDPLCQGETSFLLPFSITSGNPDRYSVTSPDLPGFTPVINAPLTASPLTVPLPANAAPGVYNFSFVLNNEAGGCNAPPLPFAVTITALPTTADAGPAQTLCAATATTLAGNTPASGTGVWTQASGPNTASFADPNLPGTQVNGLVTGTYVFRWTISNGACPPSSSSVTVTVTPAVTTANAGPDFTQYNSPVFNLNANRPIQGTGSWSVLSGSVSLGSNSDPKTTATLAAPGTAQLVWTIGNGGICPDSKDTVTLTYTSRADIQISKTITEPGPYLAGQPLMYRIEVINAGPSDATNVRITDALPPGFIGQTPTVTANGNASVVSDNSTATNIDVVANIASGGAASIVIEIPGKINADFSGELGNTATALSPEVPDPDGATSSISVPVVRRPYLNLVKSALATAVAGETVQFVITADNSSMSNAQNALITDTIDARITGVSWSARAEGPAVILSGATGTGNNISVNADLPGGSAGRIVITVTGTVTADASGFIDNAAYGMPSEPFFEDPFVSNPTRTVIMSSPGIVIDKSRTSPVIAVAGTQVDYVITVRNNGPSNATGTTITDNVPAAVTDVSWTASAQGGASVLSGASGTGNNITVTGNLPAGTANIITIKVSGIIQPEFSGLLSNTVTATPSEPGVPPVTDTDIAAVRKTVDLSINKNGPATAIAGGQISYVIDVSNAGPSAAANASITDAVPSALTNVSWTASVLSGTAQITDGATGTGNAVDVTATMSADAVIRIIVNGTIQPSMTGIIRNSATVTPSEPNTQPVSSQTVLTAVARRPEMNVTKAGPDTARAGNTINYLITVLNSGPSNARGLKVTDTVPAAIQQVTWNAVSTGSSAITSPASGNGNIISLTGDIAAGALNTIIIRVNGIVTSSFTGTLLNRAIAKPAEIVGVGDTATKETIVISEPAISITKSSVDEIQSGDILTYQIEVMNTGLGDAKNIVITDAVPPELSGVSWTAQSSGTASISGANSGTGNNISVTATIPAGVSNKIGITIKGKSDPGFNGNITNTARAVPSEAVPPAAAIKVVKVNKQPEVNIVKTGPSILSAGSAINYRILVTNTGNPNADGLIITDLVPAAVEQVSWTAMTAGGAVITAGQSGTGNQVRVTANIPGGGNGRVIVSIDGKVNAGFSGTFENTAIATPVESGAKADTSGKVLTTVISRPRLSINKAGPVEASAGETITYVLTLTNAGPSNASGAIISDDLPALLENPVWTTAVSGGAEILSGATGTGHYVNITGNVPADSGRITVTIKGTIPAGTTADSIENIAEVTPSEPGIPSSFSPKKVTKIVKRPSLAISKTGPSSIFAGENITYTIKVNNFGPSTASGAVITDTIPGVVGDIRWKTTASGDAIITSGATGSTREISVTANIPPGDDNVITIEVNGKVQGNFTGTILNRATAAASEPGIAPVFSEVTTEVTKYAELKVLKSGPANVIPGNRIVYTIQAFKEGPSNANNVIITDLIPAGILNVSWIATGLNGAVVTSATTGTGNVQVQGNIPDMHDAKILIVVEGRIDPAFGGTSLFNGAIGQNDPTINTQTDTSDVVSAVTPAADLRITKSGPANGGAGQEIQYILRAENFGPSSAPGAVIQDLLAAGVINASWSVTSSGNAANITPASGNGNVQLTADLPAKGSFVEITVTGTLSPALVNGSLLGNTATIALAPGSAVSDPNPANNTSTVNTVVDNDPVLRISKSGPALVNVGDSIHYRIVVTNGGSGNITGAIISDVVPSDVTVSRWSAVATGTAAVTGAASGNTNNISTTGDIPVGFANSLVVQIHGIVNNTSGSTIVNTANVIAGANKSSSVVTTVNNSTDISIVKTGPQQIVAGQPVRYTIRVFNNGPVDADSIVITDMIPPEITQITWSAIVTGNGSVLDSQRIDSSGNSIILPAKLAAGEDNYISIEVSGVVSGQAAAGNIDNTASVTVENITDHNPGNNTSTVSTAINRQITSILRKRGPSGAIAGNRITYDLVFASIGPSDANGVTISDVVPPQITNVSWAVTVNGAASVTGPFSGTGNNVQTVVNVPAGAGNSVSVTVTGIIDPAFSGDITNIATAVNPDINKRDTLVTRVQPGSALAINKTGPASVTAGGTISYVITATNNGPSDAAGITVTDTLDQRILQPSWTATASNGAVIGSGASGTGNLLSLNADIPAGENAFITITVTGAVAPGASGQIVNTATVSSPDPLTQAAVSPAVITQILLVPSFSVVKNAPSQIPAGETIEYVLQVNNNGPSDAMGAVITDTVPGMILGTQWSVESATGGASVISGEGGAGNNISITANFPAGSSLLVIVRGKVDSSFSGSILNTLIVKPSEPGIPPDTAQARTNVGALPLLRITKSGSPVLIAGQPVNYTIEVINEGPSTARNARISDIVNTVVNNITWTATAAGQTVIHSGASGTGNEVDIMADIPPGTQNRVTIAVSGIINGTYRGTLENIAYATAAETGITDSAATSANVVGLPRIQIAKNAPDTVGAGHPIHYTLVVTNTGLSDASQLTITDIVPESVRVTAWQATAQGKAVITGPDQGTLNLVRVTADLPAGADNSITVSIDGIVRAGVTGEIVNTASAIPSEPGLNGQDATTTSSVITDANLLISKTGPAQMNRGERATYVITASNFGPGDEADAFITDTIPDVLTNITWTAEPLGSARITSGSSGSGAFVGVHAYLPAADSSGVRIVVTGDVSQSAPAGTVRNIAYVNGIESPPVNSTIVALTDLSISKNGPAIMYTGNQATYDITVSNAGPGDAHNSIVADTLPASLMQAVMQLVSAEGGAAGVQLSSDNGVLKAAIGTFPAGAKVLLRVSGTATGAGLMLNKATVTPPAGMTESSTRNNISFAVTEVLPKVPLQIEKTISPVSDNYPQGSKVTYTLTIRNTSRVSSVNPVTVTDTLPSEDMANGLVYGEPPRGTAAYNSAQHTLIWEPGILMPGESLTWSYDLTVNGEGVMRNIAIVAGPPDISIPDTAEVSVTAGVFANMRVIKELATAPPLSVGQMLEFAITATNQGPDTATGVTISDPLAAGFGLPVTISDGGTYHEDTRTITWQIPSMASGSSRTLRFTVRILSGTAVTNTVTVAANERDVDLSDNTFSIPSVPLTGDDIFIPNVITPNGDGRNDYFVIHGLERYPGSILTIYNRWGNQVYQRNNYDNKWNGDGLNEGTYFYILKLREQQGTERLYKGWILLTR